MSPDGHRGGSAAEQKSLDAAAKCVGTDKNAVGMPVFGLPNENGIGISFEDECRYLESGFFEFLRGSGGQVGDPPVFVLQFLLRPFSDRRDEPPDPGRADRVGRRY